MTDVENAAIESAADAYEYGAVKYDEVRSIVDAFDLEAEPVAAMRALAEALGLSPVQAFNWVRRIKN